MRPFRAAFAALALLAAPSALLAQQANQQLIVQPIPGQRPHPMPSGAHRSPNRPYNQYPVLIDGSVVNRVLATPTPAPKHTHKPHPQNNGQDVFETHSTDDAK